MTDPKNQPQPGVRSAEEIAEANRRAEENRRRQLDDSKKALEEQNAAAAARMENVRPTPTQEENDRAKLGLDTDDKEDHGAQEDVFNRSLGAGGPAPYQTRDMRPQQQPASREPAPATGSGGSTSGSGGPSPSTGTEKTGKDDDTTKSPAKK